MLIHSKKMVALIERYQQASGEEKEKESLRKQIEKEISLQRTLLGEKQNVREEITGIIDADEEQAKIPTKRKDEEPIDKIIVCE
ncbi:MAG: hypothetical protein XE08_0645 [Parcubacteria bacterium 32_520]|jgi:hypothetical protein|nr:MAG: hypothetical protein XE08_0645 [Parcubacteria bacterium 32_520]